MDTDEEVLYVLEEAVQGEIYSEPTPKKRQAKPKVTTAWNNETILCLIEAVEQENSVWQYSAPVYKDRDLRNKAWHNISQKLPNHSIDECKAKWTNIKTTYQSTRKKHLQNKSGQGASEDVPHWPFWSAMKFYDTHDTNKSTSSASNFLSSSDDSQQIKMNNNATNQKDYNSCPQEANKEKFSNSCPQEAMNLAMKYLTAEDEDQWHTIGMYLASQFRQIAKINTSTANKLYLE